jgi:hypothetical protein
MSDNRKINIYVNSKNWIPDESTSNFHVIIPDGLLNCVFIIVIIIVINSNLCSEIIQIICTWYKIVYERMVILMYMLY